MEKIRIAELRKSRHMSQGDLAQLLGVTFQSVSKWETGKNYPDLPLLVQMADLFEVSLDNLLGRKENAGKSFVRKDSPDYWRKEVDFLEATRNRFWNDDYLQFLVKHVWKIHEPIDIVDFGCGYGYLAMKLMPLMPEGSSYTGIDISQDLLDKAQKAFEDSGKNVKFIHEDIYQMEAKPEYDLAICQALLRHLTEPWIALDKMVQSTKEGGRVVCIEVNRVFEEAGYYNSQVGYDPMVLLEPFNKVWHKEMNEGLRDYASGIKVPHKMASMGLTEIDVRMNDRISFAHCCSEEAYRELGQLVSRIRGFEEDTSNHGQKMADYFRRHGVDSQAIEVYLNQHQKNCDAFEKGPDGSLLHMFGMIITSGVKAEGVL